MISQYYILMFVARAVVCNFVVDSVYSGGEEMYYSVSGEEVGDVG